MASAYQTHLERQRKEAREAQLAQRGGAIEKLAPLCINCAHFAADYEFTYGKFKFQCREPLLRDPINGWPTDATLNRKSGIGCGPNGVFFKLKRAPEESPREIYANDESEPETYAPPVPVRLLESRPDDDEPACIRYRRSM